MGNVRADGHDVPEIVTYRIPRIEVHQVTEDELCRIEEGAGQVAQDLAFALSSVSVCISLVVGLLTGDFSTKTGAILGAVAGVFGMTALYTGIRWLRGRKAAPDVIAKIRSRKRNPE